LRRLSNIVIFLGYTTDQEVLEMRRIQENHPPLYFFSDDHYGKSGKSPFIKGRLLIFPFEKEDLREIF